MLERAIELVSRNLLENGINLANPHSSGDDLQHCKKHAEMARLWECRVANFYLSWLDHFVSTIFKIGFNNQKWDTDFFAVPFTFGSSEAIWQANLVQHAHSNDTIITCKWCQVYDEGNWAEHSYPGNHKQNYCDAHQRRRLAGIK